MCLNFCAKYFHQVTSGWTAEADAKRLAALAACMEAEPIPVVNHFPEESGEPEHAQRGRAGAAADVMAVDSSSKPSSKKAGRKGGKAATAAAGGVKKKKKQSAGQKVAKEFGKKQKKHRR